MGQTLEQFKQNLPLILLLLKAMRTMTVKIYRGRLDTKCVVTRGCTEQ